jgi:type II secretory pathway pseudopilin PulG
MQKKHIGAGMSIIEVVLAASFFVIFSSAAVLVIVQGLSSNRLGKEETIASQYAAEGLEAARSIRNQNFGNLVNTSGTGIIQSGGVWIFSGSNNQFGTNNKYTRAITISDVSRDTNGNIVQTGGTVDVNTKKIGSTVTWYYNPTRNNTVALTTYLTNWRSTITAGTCNDYAIVQGYASGTCRQNTTQCTHNGESNLAAGDALCVGNGSNNTCCAFPNQGGSPTPSPSTIPSSTPTPSPTTTPVTCSAYCVSLGGYTTGTCRQNSVQCAHNGETYEVGGASSCVGNGSNDSCCCHQ